VFEDVVRCPEEDLRRARFSKGPLAPKGFLYYICGVNPTPDLPAAVIAALRTTISRMLNIPLPYTGVKGIRSLAKALRTWPRTRDENTARSWLANVIRMQEEIGTGGGGFRFMYAAFLDEAADLLNKPTLREVSGQLTEVGDRWRDFGVQGAQAIRAKEAAPAAYDALAEIVHECASREEIAFKTLRRAL
jgi:hypothetical protein